MLKGFLQIINLKIHNNEKLADGPGGHVSFYYAHFNCALIYSVNSCSRIVSLLKIAAYKNYKIMSSLVTSFKRS